MANDHFDVDEVGLDSTAGEHRGWSPSSTTRRQAKIVKSILAGHLRMELMTAGGREAFLAEHEACFAGGDYGSILHAVIREYYDTYGRNEDKLKRLKPLLRLVLGKYPSLLDSQNPMGETTLQFAIRKRLSQMTRLLCSCAPARAVAALEACGVGGRTCLHAAIHHELDLDAIHHVLSICRPALLVCADDAGDTPLHLAVRYPDMRPRARARPVDESPGAIKDERTPAASQHALRGTPRAWPGATRPSARDCQDETGSGDVLLGFMQRILPAIISDQPYSSTHVLDLVKDLVQRNDAALGVKNHHGRTPYLERVHQTNRFGVRKTPEAAHDRPKEIWSAADSRPPSEPVDSTARYMLEYCVREFSPEKASACLYEPGQERHVTFDLSTLSQRSITTDYLRRLSMHVRLESVLKYVALPRLRVDTALDPGDSRTSSCFGDEGAGSRGRSDLLLVFEWLRRQGVGRIFKVSVEDDQDPPHSDAAIEAALRGFDVEIWDWKRPDLSADVICNSTAKASEIFLYSSGNNAVLAGWASPHTLSDRCKFPELRRIHLFVQKARRQGWEDAGRLAAYTEHFKASVARQTNNRVQISQYAWDARVSSAGAAGSTSDVAPPSISWHDCVSSLAKLLRTVARSRRKGAVKIAILDDGVDLLCEGLNVSIGDGASFDGPEATSSPWFISSSPGSRGTCMAAVVGNLCPESQLYIAKITAAGDGNGDKVASAASAARAIEWAMSRRVDDGGVIMFTAAPDADDPRAELACPIRSQRCITIGACDDAGAPLWPQARGSAMANFFVPGKDVAVPGAGAGRRATVSGSAFAAAAACALAGVLILCLRCINWPVDARLVRRAFKALAGDGKFVRVHDFLHRRLGMHLERARRGAVAAPGPDPPRQAGRLDLSASAWDRGCVEAALRAMFEHLLVSRPDAEPTPSRLDGHAG
ncbi:Peptidase S8/S53, subtilisin/kexin/sedolisin [Metarhizium album ARSEF 1941]|uniref:Peptidase S8/S53, subtilisin/kexin/sedolisin n=1 Tax=Metarhizium album (strain ARSEF 1941) TaxID=1081103 RepID=A0A0B2WGS6_METAS|nr:Peptidase S8/S53, subtilisin/kexin/sedolisin [Metarhizium album ARSEF 1941]KHN95206.1 Peptidase S8/S53, subtilisin/kexin/sedolisin [Metarhizium album ARSEF 1941]